MARSTQGKASPKRASCFCVTEKCLARENGGRWRSRSRFFLFSSLLTFCCLFSMTRHTPDRFWTIPRHFPDRLINRFLPIHCFCATYPVFVTRQIVHRCPTQQRWVVTALSVYLECLDPSDGFQMFKDSLDGALSEKSACSAGYGWPVRFVKTMPTGIEHGVPITRLAFRLR